MSGLILPYRNHIPRIGADVFIAQGAVVIGNVVIGNEANIWFNAVIRGDVNEIRIGDGTNIQDGCIIHVTSDGCAAHIGRNITVGHNAILHACTIEDNCLIGMGSTVMDGAVVEEGAMVAAGALVPPGKRVKRGELWSGSPAQFRRPLTPEETIQIAQSAQTYKDLAREYRAASGK